MVNICWTLFKWGLLTVAIVVAVAVPYCYRRLDEELRRQIEARFASHYAGLKVTVRAAEFVEGEGIEIRGLSIIEPQAAGPQAELLNVREIFLSCRGDLEELICAQPEVRLVRVKQPTLRMTRRPDGAWSAARLLPLPQFGRVRPDVVVESGTVELFDPLKSPATTLVVRDVNLKLMRDGKLGVAGAAPTPPGYFEGSIASDYFRRLQVRGQIDAEKPSASVAGAVEGLGLTSTLIDALPSELAQALVALRPLRGQVDLTFACDWDRAAAVACRFDVSGKLQGGRFEDARFPHPLTELAASFRATNEGVAVEQLTARANQASITVPYYRRGGYGAHAPWSLKAEVEDLELDRSLMNVLPVPLRLHWTRLLPSGHVRAEIALECDGQRWQPNITVDCHDVALTFYKFPYRLERANGRATLHQGMLQVGLRAYAGNQPLRVDGKLSVESPAPYGDFTIATEEGEGVDLDDRLLAAMAEQPRAILSSLAPRGRVKFVYRAWNESPGEPMRKYLEASLNHCSVRYERFPYPLTNIGGHLRMADDQWWFENLSGSNDTGRIACNGQFGPGPDGNELLLNFQGSSVPLEEELRDALPHPNIRRLWSDLRLQGMAELLGAEVRYRSADKRLSVAFQARPQQGTTSIELAGFPYRLENLDGVVDYRDGVVRIEQFRAQHANTSLRAAVSCELFDDGSWRLDLGGLAIDNLEFNRELVQALPERLRRVVSELNPQGPLHARGEARVARGGGAGDRLWASWTLDEVVFQQGSIDFGLKLNNIAGALKTWGQFDGQQFWSRGNLDVDSLTFNGLQFTRLEGPFYLDDQQVRLGTAVPLAGDEAPRSLAATLFGGKAHGDGTITLGPQPGYQVRATLAEGDLRRYAAEMVPGQQDLNGKIYASVELKGQGRTLQGIGGRGKIQLREADIYQLPLMIALLKILSVREPDRSAFRASDIDLIVDSGHIYFNQIHLRGDALSLVGRGEMDFQTNLNLTFGARLGNGRFDLPIIREVLGGAGDQIVLIHVQGPLRDPQIWRDPFPGVNKALQELQAELDPGVEPPRMAGDERRLPLKR